MNDNSPAKKLSDSFPISIKIAVVYALAGGLWILFSDKLLAVLVSDPETLTQLQTFKGWFYVIVTAYLLYVFIQRSFANIQRSEQSLRESEERYRSLTDDVLDSSTVGIFILDKDFRVLWVNQALERYFGLQRDEIIGRDKRQLIRQRIKDIFEDPENFAERVIATYDDNTYIENFECHVLPDDGCEERWLEHWSQPIRSGLYAGGRIEHYYDITGRVRAEQALLESEERYRLVFENAPFSIWMCDEEGTITFANQAALDLFGVADPNQIIGRYNIYRDTTEDEKPLLAHFERAWAGEVVRFHQELDMTTVKYDTARQETLYLHSTLFAIPVGGGQRTNIVVVQEDITERVRAENELHQRVNDMAALYEASQVFLDQINVETTLENVCRLAVERFGLKMAWVGLVVEGDYRVHPATAYGFEEGYLDSIHVTWDESPTGRGSTGEAIRTAQAVPMNHIDTEADYEPWRSAAIERGYRSLAALPLIHGEEVLGVLNVYSGEPEYFTPERLQVLQSLANLAALGLQKARLYEQEQRYAAELERRVNDRTAELRKLVNAMAGREVRMVELKNVIRSLRQQLKDAGLTPMADDPLKPPEVSTGSVTEE